MPNRIIRESCRTSPNLNSISAEAERLFWRQVTVADDHGCFDADPRVMLAQCFPLLIGTVTVEQVQAWRDECVRADLMRLYEHKGRTYGVFPTWFEHQRAARSKRKFPAPPRKTPDVPQSSAFGTTQVHEGASRTGLGQAHDRRPLDVVVLTDHDHNPPQPAADCCNPPLGVVSRESLVVNREIVNRESLVVNRESGIGPPAAEQLLVSGQERQQPGQQPGIPEHIRAQIREVLARARSPGRGTTRHRHRVTPTQGEVDH
ncbi:MAG: hypothetical protein QN174_07655 [Armatimonadota bacterium]|nr:hypothetical protein [Armatimonadota bacterium]